jgi:hypothetical protein
MSTVITNPPRVTAEIVAAPAQMRFPATRARLKAGQMRLGIHNMREDLSRKGLTYRSALGG